jgi:hypothetical protein
MNFRGENGPVGRGTGKAITEAEISRRSWIAPQVRRLETSEAEGSTDLGPDAELVS